MGIKSNECVEVYVVDGKIYFLEWNVITHMRDFYDFIEDKRTVKFDMEHATIYLLDYYEVLSHEHRLKVAEFYGTRHLAVSGLDSSDDDCELEHDRSRPALHSTNYRKKLTGE